MYGIPLLHVNAHASMEELNILHPGMMEANALVHEWTLHRDRALRRHRCVSPSTSAVSMGCSR